MLNRPRTSVPTSASVSRRVWSHWACGWLGAALLGLAMPVAACAQGEAKPRAGLNQPVHREAPAKVATRPDAGDNERQHPLTEALQLAQAGIERIDREVKDYTCTMIKRENYKGRLGEPETMEAKFRQQPFSVYFRFVEPSGIRDREVIYVEGQNDGKMWAHEGRGIRALAGAVQLDPNGSMAMAGQRYPITNAGMRNLLVKLVEVAERDMQFDDVQVRYYRKAKFAGRPCLCIEVIHPERHEGVQAYLARVYVDQELQLPVRYEAFDWPKSPDADPELLEQYSYTDVKVNVGLTDADFDPKNPAYKFKRK